LVVIAGFIPVIHVYERVLRKDALKLWVERCEAQVNGVLDVLEAKRAAAVSGDCAAIDSAELRKVRRCNFLPFSPCGRRWRGRSPCRMRGLFLSIGRNPSPVSNSLRSFEPPSPARGEGKKA
jgi:hypothetical protein